MSGIYIYNKSSTDKKFIITQEKNGKSIHLHTSEHEGGYETGSIDHLC